MFKAFAMRGTVMGLAAGVIIGGAFGKMVSSFKATRCPNCTSNLK